MNILTIALTIIIATKIWDAIQIKKGRYIPKKEPINYKSYANSYVKKSLLTKREQQEYLILRDAAEKRNLRICPKVRLLDLVEPKSDAQNRQGLLARVWSKHVDFVICNRDMEVICIIELDDTTHLRQDRIERDQFVDEVLKGSGYKIIHTWAIEPDIFDFLDIRVHHLNQSYEEWRAAKLAEEKTKESPSNPSPQS